MQAKQTTLKTIDQYIAAFPKDVQPILRKVRLTVRRAAPRAQETISYQIPSFTLGGRNLIHFAGYKKHVGLYPAPTRDPKFKADLSMYASGQSTAKFPLDKPIPFALIAKIVKYYVKENTARAAAGKKR